MSGRKYFNTAGPVNCEDHYCLPPMERIDSEEVNRLIDQKKYFVLHAPRQTGKTTCLLALMKMLNERGDVKCLYANFERGQSARNDVYRGVRAVIGEIASMARDFLDDRFPVERMKDILDLWGEDSALNELLSQWCQTSPKPLVLLIDEIDALVGDVLISVLRQLRAGYVKRPSLFPQSILLCGVRDVRDYRIHSEKEKSVITGGSAFNIKAKSLRLGNFDRRETAALLKMHEKETGQPFEPEVESLIWGFSGGQPWLVNALAYEACFEIKEGRDRKNPITGELIQQAKENLILRRETHLDQLADKLKEDRVRAVIQPLLTGTTEVSEIREDDLQYVVDLGLVRRKPQITVSNEIYREIIPRMLTGTTQDSLPFQTHWYVRADGLLDMEKLLTAFQEFFREHSEHWVERFDYKEAGPQLLLQAFLQRIINSGGRIHREYGLGRKRTDLLVIWNHQTGVRKVVIELKILRKSLEATTSEGLVQTADYMDRCGADEGHLVIFDRRPKRKWAEKIFQERGEYEGKVIAIWGM